MSEDKIVLEVGKNDAEVTGLLKTMELERKTNKDNKPIISGNIVVEVEDNSNPEDIKMNNIRVGVYATKFKKDGTENKLYSGLVTVSDEYKSIDKHGREEADMIQVSGSISSNMYMSKDGDLRESTQVRGVFFNRVDKETPQEALAQMKLLVDGLSDQVDSDGLPTGTKNVDAYFIEYGGTPGRMTKLVVEGELADQFGDLFTKGDTAEFIMKIQNYSTKVEPSAEATGGFGIQKQVGNNGGNFKSNMEIIGGSQAFQDGREYTPEEIEAIHASYEEKKKAKVAQGSGPKIDRGSTNGFGTTTSNTASANPFGGSTGDDSGVKKDDNWDF